MNNKIGLVVLAVLTLGLGIGLIVTKKQAADKQASDAGTINDFSNQWTQASIKVDELQQVNLTLNNNLATNQILLVDLSNNLTSVSETLANLRGTLQSAHDQIASQTTRISDLQTQNKLLDDRASALTEQTVALTNRINALNLQINNTLHQLSLSETNNELLDQQLEQLVEMKAELEHKFNTLAAVRDQVKKLREEVIAARRLAWMKEGVGLQLKGGQRMLIARDANFASMSAHKSTNAPNYGLDVEVGSDGSVRAIPPLGSTATNSPAH